MIQRYIYILLSSKCRSHLYTWPLSTHHKFLHILLVCYRDLFHAHCHSNEFAQNGWRSFLPNTGGRICSFHKLSNLNLFYANKPMHFFSNISANMHVRHIAARIRKSYCLDHSLVLFNAIYIYTNIYNMSCKSDMIQMICLFSTYWLGACTRFWAICPLGRALRTWYWRYVPCWIACIFNFIHSLQKDRYQQEYRSLL